MAHKGRTGKTSATAKPGIEERFSLLVDQAADSIFLYALDGQILEVNHTACQTLGYSRAELLRSSIHDIDASASPEKLAARCSTMFAGNAITIHGNYRRKDGSHFAVEIRMACHESSIGAVITAYVRDMSEHLQNNDTRCNERLPGITGNTLTEQASAASQAQFRSLVEATSDWIWEIDEHDRFTYVSPKIKELLGYEPEEALGRSAFELMPAQEAQRVDEVYRQLIENHQPFNGMINVNRHKDGHEVILESSGIPLFDDNGRWCGYRGIDRDITQRQLGERALQRERNFARKLLDTAPVIVMLLDLQGRIKYVNDHFEHLTGFRLDEIRDKEWFSSFLPAPDQDRIRTLFQTSLSVERTQGNINPIIIRNGKERQIEWYDNTLLDDKGNVQELLVIGQDVTERIRSEQALRQSAAEWEHAMNAFSDPIYLLDTQRRFVRANHAFYEMTGATEEHLVGRHIADILHPEGEAIPCPVCRAQEEKRDCIITMEAEHPDNPAGVPIEVNCKIIRDSTNAASGIIMSIHDLSHSRQEEERLRLSEAQLSEAQALGHMGNWNWDIQRGSLQWSDEIYRIFGLHPQAFNVTYEAFMERVHPLDRELVKQSVDRAINEMQPYAIDHRIRLTDGSVRFVHEQGEVRFDENGEPLRMFGTVQDITERKLAEQALRKSNDRFRATFEQAAVGIAHVGLNGGWLRVNDRLCDIIGYSRSELLKTTFQNITHADDLQTVLTMEDELLSGTREHCSVENRYLMSDGSITWTQLTLALVRDINNQADYFIVVVEAINYRKAAEARLLTTLAEKDTVLRELHHRVKNNMQVISSLLSLQARYIDHKNPEQALQESRQRIRAMALIHERLYGNTDLAAVDFLDYLHYLCDRLERLYHTQESKINLQVSGKPVRLTVDTALPCALICNELITNAIRHAYDTDHAEQLIEIRLDTPIKDRVQIVVRDYGRSIHADKLSAEPSSLGLVIIRALTRQLNAKIQFESTDGTTATLLLPLNSTTIPVNDSSKVQH